MTDHLPDDFAAATDEIWKIAQEAVEAADRILLAARPEYLEYLTVELARRFAEKVAVRALHEIFKKEFMP
jgi:hypothetical protein